MKKAESESETMPLVFDNKTGWTQHPPTPVPYEAPEHEPETTYSFFWPHDLIHEANVLILSKGMDPLKAIHIVDQTRLKKTDER